MASDGADRIYASCLADSVINGGIGNDLLQVKCNATTAPAAIASHSNTFNGGPGADKLYGNASSDSYTFAIGDGQDLLMDTGYNFGKPDEIVFGAGITPGIPENQAVQHRAADRIRRRVTRSRWAAGLIRRSTGSSSCVLSIMPAWTMDLAQIEAAANTGTAGDDVLIGWDEDLTLTGLDGNDTIQSGSWQRHRQRRHTAMTPLPTTAATTPSTAGPVSTPSPTTAATIIDGGGRQ